MFEKTWHWVVTIILLPVIFTVYSVWGMLFNKPAQLLDKATDTTKMLANYEWFYESANNYKSRVNQIKAHTKLIADEKDKSELSRLRIELVAMQSSCRDLVAKYEAQSGKIHVGYLKSKDLPESLNMKECE